MTLISTPITGPSGSTAATYSGAGTRYVVEANNGDLYCIYLDFALDVVYRKSTDDGVTWGSPVAIFTGSATQLSVWFDRWSGISAGLIHVAYTESITDDTFYRTINTESSDSLSTQTTIFAGASTALTGALSITRARGGNVFCMVCIDAGAESTTKKLLNANVPNGAWSSALADGTEAGGGDQWILLPGWDADNQDIMCFFWDSSADEISRKLYDDSANSWSETSIATTMVDALASATFPHFAATVDIANSRNILVAWSGVDLAGADLRCWTVTESSITEVTAVVTDSVDDQGLCAIGIDTSTGHWYAYYCGASSGVETWNGGVNVYRKVSTDSGTTWGSEEQVSAISSIAGSLVMTPRHDGAPTVLLHNGTGSALCVFIDVTIGGGGSGVKTPLFGGGVL